jgi:hypothetical protein
MKAPRAPTAPSSHPPSGRGGTDATQAGRAKFDRVVRQGQDDVGSIMTLLSSGPFKAVEAIPRAHWPNLTAFEAPGDGDDGALVHSGPKQMKASREGRSPGSDANPEIPGGVLPRATSSQRCRPGRSSSMSPTAWDITAAPAPPAARRGAGDLRRGSAKRLVRRSGVEKNVAMLHRQVVTHGGRSRRPSSRLGPRFIKTADVPYNEEDDRVGVLTIFAGTVVTAQSRDLASASFQGSSRPQRLLGRCARW